MKHKKILLLGLLFLSLSVQSFAQTINAPAPWGPTPSERQLKWHETEYYALPHYTMGTYTESQWPWGDESPELINPTKYDADKWCRVFKAAGMRGVVFFVKHHDGFCTYQSEYTTRDMESSPWKNGKGDMLAEMAEACKKHGLKLGIYYSPWDRNRADWGKPGYLEYWKNQMRELMTNYGDVFMIWFDGAHGTNGYYGGSDHERPIGPIIEGKFLTEYYMETEKEIIEMARELQPDACFFNSHGPDVRWAGNEKGVAGETNWSRLTLEGKGWWLNGFTPDWSQLLTNGDECGKDWIAAEADNPSRTNWFWRPYTRPKSLTKLVDTYYNTVGRNATLNFGISIDKDGDIPQQDIDALIELKQTLDQEFAVNLLDNAGLSADNVRGQSENFKATLVGDGNKDTYWATDDGISDATIIIDFGKKTSFNRLLLQEYIRLGQRVNGFYLEALRGNSWEKVIQGTTIGYKRILRFETVEATKVRVRIWTKAPCLAISNMGIYNAPALLDDPEIHREKSGMVKIETADKVDIYYKIGNQPHESDFKPYTAPFELRDGGTVNTFARDPATDRKTSIISETFGISPEKWTIHSYSNETSSSKAVLAIDGNPHTWWETLSGYIPSVGGTPKEMLQKRKLEDTLNYIAIDLGESIDINGFTYQPRDNGRPGGKIYDYEFYASKDSKNWGVPLSKGSFGNIDNSPIKQFIRFPGTKNVRYVKLVIVSTISDLPGGAAEIGVLN